MDINEQLVKEERIKTAPLPRLFDIFNADRTGSENHKVTWFVLLKLEINEYTENINIVVVDLDSMNMFLGHDWLIKYNLEVN